MIAQKCLSPVFENKFNLFTGSMSSFFRLFSFLMCRVVNFWKQLKFYYYKYINRREVKVSSLTHVYFADRKMSPTRTPTTRFNPRLTTPRSYLQKSYIIPVSSPWRLTESSFRIRSQQSLLYCCVLAWAPLPARPGDEDWVPLYPRG